MARTFHADGSAPAPEQIFTFGSNLSGYYGAATASGRNGKAKGEDGCALFLAERNSDGEIVAVWSGIVGRNGIKADTFYRLVGGDPMEVA